MSIPITRNLFDEFYDFHHELHKLPIDSKENALNIAESLIRDFPEDFQDVTKEKLASVLWKWYSWEGLESCHCDYCERRRGRIEWDS